METQSSAIAKLNDEFRHTGFTFLFTPGARGLGDDKALLAAIRSFDSFSEDNDPYGEHDFGSFELFGETLFWKIDYYNDDLSAWCDPLDPACKRALTLMLAEEY